MQRLDGTAIDSQPNSGSGSCILCVVQAYPAGICERILIFCQVNDEPVTGRCQRFLVIPLATGRYWRIARQSAAQFIVTIGLTA